MTVGELIASLPAQDKAEAIRLSKNPAFQGMGVFEALEIVRSDLAPARERSSALPASERSEHVF
jgi:hypothetical protein